MKHITVHTIVMLPIAIALLGSIAGCVHSCQSNHEEDHVNDTPYLVTLEDSRLTVRHITSSHVTVVAVYKAKESAVIDAGKQYQQQLVIPTIGPVMITSMKMQGGRFVDDSHGMTVEEMPVLFFDYRSISDSDVAQHGVLEYRHAVEVSSGTLVMSLLGPSLLDADALLSDYSHTQLILSSIFLVHTSAAADDTMVRLIDICTQNNMIWTEGSQAESYLKRNSGDGQEARNGAATVSGTDKQ